VNGKERKRESAIQHRTVDTRRSREREMKRGGDERLLRLFTHPSRSTGKGEHDACLGPFSMEERAGSEPSEAFRAEEGLFQYARVTRKGRATPKRQRGRKQRGRKKGDQKRDRERMKE
jgi:hypothetical protein